jgi:hypothetical protein
MVGAQIHFIFIKIWLFHLLGIQVLLEYLQHGSSTVQRKAFWELFPGILVLCAFESFANHLELDMISIGVIFHVPMPKLSRSLAKFTRRVNEHPCFHIGTHHVLTVRYVSYTITNNVQFIVVRLLSCPFATTSFLSVVVAA